MVKPPADFVYRQVLPRSAVEELRSIIYDIKPKEVAREATRALSRKESEELAKLLRQKKWKKWSRYMAKVNKRRT
jgi:hypothetical protein